MKFFQELLVAAAFLLQTVLGAVPVPLIPTGTSQSTASIIPRTYIVQLKDNPTLSKRGLSAHDAFHNDAKAFKYSTRQAFNDKDIFVGLSLTLDNDGDIATLAGIDNVAGIWPVSIVKRPSAVTKPIPPQPDAHNRRDVPVKSTNYSIPYITGNTDVNHPHNMSEVHYLHLAGIRGHGIKIAVIDTGVDFRHPSLGGCFGQGCKISFGYDFTGDQGDPAFPGSPTPLATCTAGGHGTHVMGIIGMEDQPGTGYGLVGVAPDAMLGMYRVFGCSGDTGADIIIAAMMKAANDGAMVISMSLGSPGINDPFDQVTQGLVEKRGIAIFAAIGNDGDLGIYFASAPGRDTSVFAVGSIMNEKFPVTYQLIDSNGAHLRYSSVVPLNTSTKGLPLQILEHDSCQAEDFAAAAAVLKKHRKNPANYIIANSNGVLCNDYETARLAKFYGYKYFLTYNTLPHEYAVSDPEVIYDAIQIFVDSEDSKTILAGYKKKPLSYRLSFSDQNYIAESPPSLAGGLMSNFSSYGPTQDFRLKPQLSAPGELILSTWSLENIGYTIISGTSMSTPYMAGCYALIKSQHPELGPDEIYGLMMSTGKPVPWIEDQSMLSSATHQGAGLVNAYKAVHSWNLISPSQLILPTSNKTISANITITNNLPVSNIYNFTHQAAGLIGFDTTQLYPYYAQVTFDQPSIEIAPNSSANVTISITPPQGVKDISFPIYSGFVFLTERGGVNYTVPYIGKL